MKLATIVIADSPRVVAQLDATRLIDVNYLLKDTGFDHATKRLQSMRQIIAGGAPLKNLLAEALTVAARSVSSVPAIEVEHVRWLPPVTDPGKICAVAMNNSASNDRKISAPDHPAFFLKPSSCLAGHREPIRVRHYYGSVHPEPELAAVIGSRVRDVAAIDAMDAIFGYSNFNDVTGNGMRAADLFHYWAVYEDQSAPDGTRRVEQHLSYAGRYKGTDTFGAMGPWLVTADEIPCPDDLAVVCRINGETIADDSTAFYNYKIAEVVSFISQFQTLEPGDIIAFGTAFKPSATRRSIHHANLQSTPGPVEVSVAGLGTLINPVAVESTPMVSWRLP